MFGGTNIHYEMSEKTRGFCCGGLGAFVKLVQQVGLDQEIDARVHVLKRHLPYHESDHVLNVAYNVLTGGVRLEDLELRRQDEVYLDALGTQRIPDPTTAGDFTRRFEAADILQLIQSINQVQSRLWDWSCGGKKGKQKKRFKLAVVDVDGTISETLGECKAGIGLSYKGIWGYAPLLLSLANTKEVLYLENRPGNVASHQNAAAAMDRVIGLLEPHAERICFRGDTDFSLTTHFDCWSERVDFVFGMDAHQSFVQRAEALPDKAWKEVARRPKYAVKTAPRQKPENVKERIVREKEYRNIKLTSEHVAEFAYRPTKCKKTYRMVALRKNLSVEKGEQVLFDDLRYFFYITTRTDLTAEEVVFFANERCDQENVIEQLKNGVNAMRMPVDNLLSNWAYMVMASLAWNMKAWLAVMMPKEASRDQVMRMEYRQFLHAFVLLPCQIVKTGRKIVYRILGYNRWLPDFFAAFARIRKLKIPILQAAPS